MPGRDNFIDIAAELPEFFNPYAAARRFESSFPIAARLVLANLYNNLLDGDYSPTEVIELTELADDQMLVDGFGNEDMSSGR